MQRVVLRQSEMDDQTMAKLVSLCPNLKRIDAESGVIADLSLPILETLKNLTSINFVGCKQLTPDKIRASPHYVICLI